MMNKPIILRSVIAGTLLVAASTIASNGASYQAPSTRDLSQIIAESQLVSGFAFIAPQEELRQLQLSWNERMASYASEEDIFAE